MAHHVLLLEGDAGDALDPRVEVVRERQLGRRALGLGLLASALVLERLAKVGLPVNPEREVCPDIETVIEFTATPGTHEFKCGMGMLHGDIIGTDEAPRPAGTPATSLRSIRRRPRC